MRCAKPDYIHVCYKNVIIISRRVFFWCLYANGPYFFIFIILVVLIFSWNCSFGASVDTCTNSSLHSARFVVAQFLSLHIYLNRRCHHNITSICILTHTSESCFLLLVFCFYKWYNQSLKRIPLVDLICCSIHKAKCRFCFENYPFGLYS